MMDLLYRLNSKNLIKTVCCILKRLDTYINGQKPSQVSIQRGSSLEGVNPVLTLSGPRDIIPKMRAAVVLAKSLIPQPGATRDDLPSSTLHASSRRPTGMDTMAPRDRGGAAVDVTEPRENTDLGAQQST